MQPPTLPTDIDSVSNGSEQSLFASHLTASGDLTSDPSSTNARLGPYTFPASQFGNVGSDAIPRPSKRSQSKLKQSKPKVLPPELDAESPSSNSEYQAALSNCNLLFSPQLLGFLPSNYWLSVDATFGDLVTKFFQRKNNANCRFPHKLYNALAIVERNPILYHFFGVQWVTDCIFKVDKLIFGRLLGIAAVDGGLFHRQGNFPSHGFAELTSVEIDPLRHAHDVSDVDQDRVRLLVHRSNGFCKGSSEEAVTRCKWITETVPRV